MKIFMATLFLVVAGLAVVHSLPKPQEADVSAIPDSSEISSEESEESYPGYFSFGRPAFFSGFENFFKSIATRLRDLATTGPREDWGKITNATSTRKVIDGHVITVNDTTYTREGNNTDSVLFVRVIDIQPNEEEGATPVVNPEVESIDGGKNDSSNEIPPAQTEERAELLERREYFPDASYDFDVDNSIDVFDTKPISLEGDILVNKVRQDQTKGGIFMVPHDVEVFDVEDGKPVYSYNPYHPYQISQRTEKIVT